MRKPFLAVVTMISVAGPAGATDVAPTTHDWTGVYLGLNAGGTWSDVEALSSNDLDFTGGGLLGYNWQHKKLVLGLEADFNYVGLGYDESLEGSFSDDSQEQLEIQTNWFGTVRGRLGFAIDDVLFYGTGGLAYGNMSSDWNIDVYDDSGDLIVSSQASTDDTNWGWTVGAGAEYDLGQWRLGLEYLYVDLGETELTNGYEVDNGFGGSASSVSELLFDHRFSIARVTAKFAF
jgi:outer membrane immunogenic protein